MRQLVAALVVMFSANWLDGDTVAYCTRYYIYIHMYLTSCLPVCQHGVDMYIYLCTYIFECALTSPWIHAQICELFNPWTCNHMYSCCHDVVGCFYIWSLQETKNPTMMLIRHFYAFFLIHRCNWKRPLFSGVKRFCRATNLHIYINLIYDSLGHLAYITYAFAMKTWETEHNVLATSCLEDAAWQLQQKGEQLDPQTSMTPSSWCMQRKLITNRGFCYAGRKAADLFGSDPQ